MFKVDKYGNKDNYIFIPCLRKYARKLLYPHYYTQPFQNVLHVWCFDCSEAWYQRTVFLILSVMCKFCTGKNMSKTRLVFSYSCS